MKTFFVLLFSISAFTNCNAQTNNSISIEYKAATRGSQVSLIASSEEIIYTSFDKNLELKMSEHQWDDIKKLVSKIELESISDLKAPSTERYTDRAMIGSLSINKNGKIYESSAFDHGNPPSEIKELIDTLFELID